MKIFGRTFHFPVKICRTSTYYTEPTMKITLKKSGMSGTMHYTSYTIDIVTKNKKFQWSFVWRPDVTRYWWKDSKKKKV